MDNHQIDSDGAALRPMIYQEIRRDGSIATLPYNPKHILADLRKAFTRRKGTLLRAMMERGDDYKCCHQSCEETTDIQIDHIVSLSEGGTNDLDNLQFLCAYHNNSKGAK